MTAAANPWKVPPAHSRVMDALCEFGDAGSISVELDLEMTTVKRYIQQAKALMGIRPGKGSGVLAALAWRDWQRAQGAT